MAAFTAEQLPRMTLSGSCARMPEAELLQATSCSIATGIASEHGRSSILMAERGQRGLWMRMSPYGSTCKVSLAFWSRNNHLSIEKSFPSLFLFGYLLL